MICRAIPYEGNDPYIFVSFCHLDCSALYPVFEQMVMDGYRFWYDNADCTGDAWLDNMENHLENCNVVIAFVSESSSMSHKCRSEITYAIKCRKKVIPILIDNAALPKGFRMQLNSLQCKNKEASVSWRTMMDSVYECEECRACRVTDGRLSLMPLPKEEPKVISIPPLETTQSFWNGLNTAKPEPEPAPDVIPIPDIPLAGGSTGEQELPPIPNAEPKNQDPKDPEEDTQDPAKQKVLVRIKKKMPQAAEHSQEQAASGKSVSVRIVTPKQHPSCIEEDSIASEENKPEIQKPLASEEVIPETQKPVIEEIEQPSISEEVMSDIQEPVEEPSIPEEVIPEIQEPVNVEVEEPSVPEAVIPEIQEPVNEEVGEPSVPEEVIPEIQEPINEEVEEPSVPEEIIPEIQEPVSVEVEEPSVPEEIIPEVLEPVIAEIEEPVVSEEIIPDILIPTEPVSIYQNENPNASESDDNITSRLLNTNFAILLHLSAERAFMLRKPHSKIGRSLIKCDIPIEGNASVSNYHADIFQEQNAVYLQDAGSVNGTFCNGQRLKSEEPIALENPAVFRLSNETLILLSGSLARQYERVNHISFVINEAHTALKLLDIDTLYLNRSNCWPDMTLADSKIHRNAHAKISCEEDGYHLINEAPLKGNGTYLNERKLKHQESALLCSGDRIRLGNTTLEYFSITI